MYKRTLKRLLIYLRPHRLLLLAAVLFASLYVVCTLLCPRIIGSAVDLIAGKNAVTFSALPQKIVYLALAVAGAALSGWLMSFVNNIISTGVVASLRKDTFDAINRAPLSYIDKRPRGEITARIITDANAVSDGILLGFSQLFTGIFTIAGTLVFMLITNWRITVAVALITPLSIIVSAFIAKGSFKYFNSQAKLQGELTACSNEYITNQKLVLAYGFGDKATADFEARGETLRKIGVRAHFYSALTNPCTRFVNGLVYAAAGVLGALSALSALSGQITVGQITMFLSYANQYTKPFNEISGILTQLQAAMSSADRLFALLDAEPEAETGTLDARASGKDAGGPGAAAVEFRELSFSYDKSKTLLNALNAVVKPGIKAAVVGPTGCGKTTLINLLLRFYDADSGAVLFNGTDVKRFTRDSLRSQFGMVLQDTWLFSGTVRENIAYGSPGASDDEIERAAKRAMVHPIIMRLPNGYDTPVVAGGANFSAGERQLLCIARAMLRDVPALILDEATSNIDTRTEILIQSAFAEIMRGKTSIVIAHRLSTIRDSDLILVLNNGTISESGKHEELMAINGFYAELYRSMTEISS